jgi:hypothetical protein
MIDRRIAMLVLAVIFTAALVLGIALAWHSYLSNLATTTAMPPPFIGSR